MSEMHTFPFPDDSDAEAMIIEYEHGSSVFLTAHKHETKDGKSRQVPLNSQTEKDGQFLEQCNRRKLPQ